LAACKAGGSGCQVNETRAGKLRRTMSALTKWNPSRKSEELEVWRPLARWDHFREMEDMMHGGERKAEKEKKGLKFHRLEWAYGRFERCFTLPDEADPDKITSEYEEGT
jgi:hypothetical protein